MLCLHFYDLNAFIQVNVGHGDLLSVGGLVEVNMYCKGPILVKF
jgi:hypothetical protein